MKILPLILGPVLLLQGCSSSLGTLNVKGTVQASKTNEEDRAVEGFIFDGKDEYHLAEGPNKEKLLDQIDAQVSVKGEVSEGSYSGIKYIDVEQFKILKKAN